MLKVNPRWYPAIILGLFTFFLALGLLLGFRPSHGSEQGRGRGLQPQALATIVRDVQA